MQSLLCALRVLAKEPDNNRGPAHMLIDEFVSLRPGTAQRKSLCAALRFEVLTQSPEETGFWTEMAGYL